MKFYPSDWRADPALRMCSIAARGLWMEMLCVMHEASPYGSLRVNGNTITPRQLASLAGASTNDVEGWLAELELSGVFSRDGSGVIVSRRMQRDKAKAEADQSNGKRGGNPNIGRGVNPADNGWDKAQKPEARSQNQTSSLRSEAPAPAGFDGFWELFPNKVGKANALKAFGQAAKRVDFPSLMVGLRRYVAKTDDRPWCNPATWLNQDRWADEPATPQARGSPPPRREGPADVAARILNEMRSANGQSRASDDRDSQALVAFSPSRFGVG